MSDLDQDVTKQRFGGSRAGPGLAAWQETFSREPIWNSRAVARNSALNNSVVQSGQPEQT